MTDSMPDKKDKRSKPAADPFQRFEDLAQKLIAVPKEEIDHAEKNYERRKKRHETNKSAR